MNVAPDPDLRRALDESLPDPEPRPGAKDRVRVALRARFDNQRRFRQTTGYFAAAAVAAVVVTVMALSQKKLLVVPVAAPHPLAAASTLVLSSGAKVLVQPGSDLRVERDDDHETSLRLGRGRLVAHVQPRAGRPFVVHGDAVRVEVVGTTFAVEGHDADIAGVGVLSGLVKVSRSGASWQIAPGESWPLDGPPLAMTEEELAWSRAEEVVGATSPVVEPSAPSSTSPPVAAAQKETRAPVPSPYAAAKQLEARGDLRSALSSYESLADSSDKSAEDARFAVGRLRAKLGDPAGALEAFRSYRTGYPNGGYARAVDVHVLDLLIAQGDDGAVLGEANRFIESHSDDARVWRFFMARAVIRIKNGDCRSALSDLETVPDREAKALRERCASSL